MSIKKNNEIIAGKYRHQVVPYASNTVAGIIRIATSAELIPTATTLAITPSQVLELLATKQNTLTAGSNIQINNNTISATNTTYTAGSGLTLTGTQFSANVVNSTSSTSTANALSANMGKELQDQINNLKSLGTYLSNWNCTTGLAETDPTISPRPYHSGDYFLVGTIATTGTNYRPSGTEYVIGQASTAVETETVAVGDCYIYDGTTWKLQLNTKRTVTFNTIAGSPYDNSDLASALNAKQNTLTAGTDISIVNNTVNFTGTIPTKISDLTDDTSTNPVDKADTLTGLTASITELNFTDGVTSNIQSQLNNKQGTLSAGSNIQIVNGIISATDTKYTAGTGISITDNVISNTQTSAEWGNITGTLANQSDLNTALNGKQPTLVSGTNIKTINNTSILGTGDITIQSAPPLDNTTINQNSSNQLQAIGVIDGQTGNADKFVSLTKAQYDALATKDANTFYNITDDSDVTLNLLQTIYPVGSIYLTFNNTCPLSALFGTWQIVGTDKVLQGAGSRGAVGTTLNESLPNITGEVTGFRWEDVASASAPFALNSNGGATGYVSGSNGPRGINFDASLSSSTYQDNAPVQPDAILVNIFKRIA